VQLMYGYLRATESKRVGRAWGATLHLTKAVAEGSTYAPTVVYMLGCVWVLASNSRTDKLSDPKARKRLQVCPACACLVLGDTGTCGGEAAPVFRTMDRTFSNINTPALACRMGWCGWP
jgi:hypothetical protein